MTTISPLCPLNLQTLCDALNKIKATDRWDSAALKTRRTQQ